MDFRNKTILAPMVRVGTLPMRMLALKYGADITVVEEVIDLKIMQSQRIVNEALGTIDYVLSDGGTVVFRTCAEERGRTVLQLGTATAERALEVAKRIEQDISAIDINMGCPKEYSTKGGMGAALLSKPDTIREILTTLVKNLSIPVTCKIRVLPELSATLDLVRLIESTGVAAITVHGRTRDERPRHPNRDDVIAAIVAAVKIPVIANGGSRNIIRVHEDIAYFRQLTGASSVSVARAAMRNPAIFMPPREDTPPPDIETVIKEYLQLAVRYDNYLASTKYCIQQMLHDKAECPGYRETLSAADLAELCDIWGMREFYDAEMLRRSIRCPGKRPCVVTSCPPELSEKRLRVSEGSKVEGQARFVRRIYEKGGTSPKQILHELCHRKGWKLPRYDLAESRTDRLFFCDATVNGVKYINSYGGKSKRLAEHAVAIVCLEHLGVDPIYKQAAAE